MQPLLSLCRTASFVFFLLLATPEANARAFHVRLTSSPQTLDWNRATMGSEKAIIQNIMEGLFHFNEHLVIVPGLAESYTWTKDGKVLEIKLKKNVRWQDDVELKPQHFLDSFERLLNPSFNSPNASVLFDIKNARDYYFGKIKKFSDVGIEVTKNQTLKITLNEPRANFLNILTHWATFPLRKDKPLVTLGPYFLEITQANTLYLKANSKYYGKKPPISEVVFEVIPDGKTAIEAYQKKKLDYLLQVEDKFLEDPSIQAIKGLSYVSAIRVVALLHFNPQRTNTDSPEKRRRIMQAINVQKIIAQSPKTRLFATSIIPPIRETTAGAPNTVPAVSGSLPDAPLLLGYPQDALSKSIAEQIQMYSEPLKIKLEPMGNRDESTAKRYDLILTIFGLDYFDSDQLISSFLSQGTHDLFHVSSSELLQIVGQARLNARSEEREAIYEQAAAVLQSKIAIVMPLFYRKRAYLLNPKYHYLHVTSGSSLISQISPLKIK